MKNRIKKRLDGYPIPEDKRSKVISVGGVPFSVGKYDDKPGIQYRSEDLSDDPGIPDYLEKLNQELPD